MRRQVNSKEGKRTERRFGVLEAEEKEGDGLGRQSLGTL